MIDEYFLQWYEPDNDNLVGDEKLDVTEEQLVCQWFTLDHHDDLLDGLIVRASQRRHLQPLVKHQMDLNKCDYFVVRYELVEQGA